MTDQAISTSSTVSNAVTVTTPSSNSPNADQPPTTDETSRWAPASRIEGAAAAPQDLSVTPIPPTTALPSTVASALTTSEGTTAPFTENQSTPESAGSMGHADDDTRPSERDSPGREGEVVTGGGERGGGEHASSGKGGDVAREGRVAKDDRLLWMEHALTYFRLIEGGASWTQLVTEWQALEAALGYPDGQNRSNWLPAKGRPEEVKMWTKNARDYDKLPKIKSVEQYAASWREWWVALQPASRVSRAMGSNSWPLERQLPNDIREWDLLRRGGCNGFFLVVVSLGWWVWAACDAHNGVEAASEAVDDVLWVCRSLTGVTKSAAPTLKRPVENSEGDSSTKRCRLE